MVRKVKARKAQCPFCPKIFTRTEHLQRHLGSHGVGKAVTCPECGKDFMRKDVMKRHLTKCRVKSSTIESGEGVPALVQQSPAVQQDGSENPVSLFPSHRDHSNHSVSQSETPSSTSIANPVSIDTNTTLALPETPQTDPQLWNDINFENIQFLFDSPFLERDGESRLQLQQVPSGFGVPCINIDPAETFNFLARIASKESSSLKARYEGPSPQSELIPGDSHPSWDAGVDPALTSISQSIVHQIKSISQASPIVHTWTPQLEKECARFFSPKNITHFIQIYWRSWHPHYPAIHKPTLSIDSALVPLLASMCIIGACFSQNENDRINAKLWLNAVEEMVFSNRCFGDMILLDEAMINVREVVQFLQAAYCISACQISEGSKVSRRRIRRVRFNMLVSLVRDLDLFNIAHRNLDSLREEDFCWDSFIATEECIRTMLFIYIHDTGYAIFSNYPPRVRIQELSLDPACPEACFQAASARECFSALKTWASHPLWKSRMRLREIVELILCTDISQSHHEIQSYLSHLGILNLWIICSALVSETLTLNTLYSPSPNTHPLRRALQNWKTAWNQRYTLQDAFGLPKEEDCVLSRVEESWRRVGFFQNAAEYWLLVNILLERIGERGDERERSVHGGQVRHVGGGREVIGLSSQSAGDSKARPYMPSRCDEAGMVDLKSLILEHQRVLS